MIMYLVFCLATVLVQILMVYIPGYRIYTHYLLEKGLKPMGRIVTLVGFSIVIFLAAPFTFFLTIFGNTDAMVHRYATSLINTAYVE